MKDLQDIASAHSPNRQELQQNVLLELATSSAQSSLPPQEPPVKILRRLDAMKEAMRSIASPIPTPGTRAIAEAVHDARNLLTALGLYCELLEEPGVLAEGFRHYGRELRLVTSATERLIEKISAVLPAPPTGTRPPRLSAKSSGLTLNDLPASPSFPSQSFATNLAGAVAENQNLLTALAGPAICVEVETRSGAHSVALAAEDLTRILINLVRNAAEAMPNGGGIRITTSDGYFSNPQPNALSGSAASGSAAAELPAEPAREPRTVLLTVEDSGPGISQESAEKLFEVGFSTKLNEKDFEQRSWPSTHRGLGLAIVRALVETAGGSIRLLEPTASASPATDAYPGACFRIELPVCSIPGSSRS